MRNFVLFLGFCHSLGCYAAGGPLDGIYSCGINLLGNYYQVYETVNGQPDGTSIHAAAAISPYNSFYGYGIGVATSTSFVGNSMVGLPFNFSINPTTHAITGTSGVLVNGQAVNATVSCVKIF
jgi:hypothetical protein